MFLLHETVLSIVYIYMYMHNITVHGLVLFSDVIFYFSIRVNIGRTLCGKKDFAVE